MSNSIEYYEKISQEDLYCGQNDIDSYLIKVGFLRSKWSKFLYIEEQLKDELEENVNSVYSERMYHYMYEAQIILDKKFVPDAIHGDSVYIESLKKYKQQQSKVKFINEVITALHQQSFYLNTAVKYMIFKSGC